MTLGPILAPFPLLSHTMVQSPTKSGIVLIGVQIVEGGKFDALFQLSGESIESLKWTILEQKLQHGRHSYVSFSVPEQTVTQLAALPAQCPTNDVIMQPSTCSKSCDRKCMQSSTCSKSCGQKWLSCFASQLACREEHMRNFFE